MHGFLSCGSRLFAHQPRLRLLSIHTHLGIFLFGVTGSGGVFVPPGLGRYMSKNLNSCGLVDGNYYWNSSYSLHLTPPSQLLHWCWLNACSRILVFVLHVARLKHWICVVLQSGAHPVHLVLAAALAATCPSVLLPFAPSAAFPSIHAPRLKLAEPPIDRKVAVGKIGQLPCSCEYLPNQRDHLHFKNQKSPLFIYT